MSNNTIQDILEQLDVLFRTTDDVLNSWDGSAGNLQFPALFNMMAIKMNWDEKQMREADPLIRHYIRKHPEWHVTRGAHGGIMRTSDKQKKEDAKIAKAQLKEQMKASIEAKVKQAAADSIESDKSE